MQIVTTTDALGRLCERLRHHPFVALDTEFMRDSTYYPKLCLLQLAGPEDEAVVDPLAAGLSLDPLYALLADAAVVKVLHAARQDVEIFWHLAQVIPAPLFDTQIAAMVCGYGESVSYEALIRKTANVQIDKSMRFTDWSRRPLNEKQLAYALGDVTHLRVAYRALKEEIDRERRHDWVASEMAVLTDPETYQTRPEDAWRRLRTRASNRRFLAVLKEVAAWREIQAQARDVPRGRVLKDDALLEIATQAPRTIEALDALRGVPRGFAGSRLSAGLLEAIERAATLPAESLPLLEREAPGGNPAASGALVDLLKVLLKLQADTHGVAQRLIATTEDLERIAAENDPAVPALQGWRREVFGAVALDLKAGRVALAARGRRVAVVPLAPGG